MLIEEVLNLFGIDILSPGNDHVLLTICKIEIPFLIHGPHVSRMEPSVSESLFRRIRVIPVALHNVLSPDHDLTDPAPW